MLLDKETLTKDLSFNLTEKSKTEEEDVDEKSDYIEFEEFDDNELCEDEYDEYDTTVVGILRVKIGQENDVVLSDDMGVRAFKVNSQGAAKKGTPAYTANDVCGVHCVPVHNAKGQLVFEIFNKTLTDFDAGSFSLTLNDLITRNSDGLYYKRQALEKSKQINIPGGNKCKVRLNAQFYSTRFESGHFDFSENTVDIDDLYRLIGMAFNAIAFNVSNDLALCFNFGSASDLFHALAALAEQIVAPIAEDSLNKPESASTGNGAPPVYSLVPLLAFPKTKSKRVHEFESNGRNKVIPYTRGEAKSFGQFETEPWVAPCVRTAVMLDDRNDRVLFIGKHTIQLWSNFAKENKTLQYIWCGPSNEQNREKDFIKEYSITWAALTKLSDEVFTIAFAYKKQGISHSIKTGFRLPRKDDPASFRTVRDASYALGILDSVECKSWPDKGYQHYETLLDRCKLIIDCALSSSDGDAFGSIGSTDESEGRGFQLKSIDDESEHKGFQLEEIGGTSKAWSKILQVLMQFDCGRSNSLIEELLKKEKITLKLDNFEEKDGQSMSDLFYAITFRRANIVRSLSLYYCERATSVNEKSLTEPDFENNLRIVVSGFGLLCEKHPDIALELVKNISYFKSNGPVVWSNKRENFAYSDSEKESGDVYKADAQDDTGFKWSRFFSNKHQNDDGYLYKECLVPLPNFTRYRKPPKSLFGFLNVFEWLKYLSPFASAVLHGKYHMFGEPAMEAIINFKWRKFAKTRYVIFIGLYSLYLLSFMAAVTLDSGRVHQGNVIKHLISLFSIIVLVLGFIFIAIEIMQMIAYRKHYIGMYNVIDLGSTILPMIYAVGAFFGSSWRLKYVGISMFFVYVDFILDSEYSMITDLVGDSPVMSDFSTPQHALVSVFFFVTGNFGSLSDAFGDPTVAFLAIVFSFITAIVLLNILIALMTDVVSNAKIAGKHVWLKQKAEFICELEVYAHAKAKTTTRFLSESNILLCER
ncbi:10301_t:CDS:2 [Paraglomus occultum]|uniref:10301_t:CDS:1 n=1 Tax=Paraglomus occultum TaxID=144539 RepID=A0A9N9G4C0_9GLOM|nr:10301_t:CDS:2 [Paraglomus occultum]